MSGIRTEATGSFSITVPEEVSFHMDGRAAGHPSTASFNVKAPTEREAEDALLDFVVNLVTEFGLRKLILPATALQTLREIEKLCLNEQVEYTGSETRGIISDMIAKVLA